MLPPSHMRRFRSCDSCARCSEPSCHCTPYVRKCAVHLRTTHLCTARHASHICAPLACTPGAIHHIYAPYTCESHTYDQSPVHRTPVPAIRSPMHSTPIHRTPVHRASPTSCEPIHLSGTASLHMASVRAYLPDITHTVPVIRSPMHSTPIHRTPVRRASPTSCGPMHLSGPVSLHMASVCADLPDTTHTARASRSPGGGQMLCLCSSTGREVTDVAQHDEQDDEHMSDRL
jgi:hypothetical protein